MATNLNDLPKDPLETEEGKPAPKPKRKRRSSAQVKADNAAIALGFKDAADQAEQEANMGEATVEAKAEERLANADTIDTATASHQEMAGKVNVLAGEMIPALSLGSAWNLGGKSFTLVYGDADTVVFKKNHG